MGYDPNNVSKSHKRFIQGDFSACEEQDSGNKW